MNVLKSGLEKLQVTFNLFMDVLFYKNVYVLEYRMDLNIYVIDLVYVH